MTFGQPKISIIIPCLNAESTIERAIKSAVGQTYENLELLVIDGGSIDASLEVLSSYQSSIATLLSEPDKGVYDAMNKGISNASGEWLFFLGADDELIDPAVLHSVFQLSNDSQLLYGDVILSGSGIVGTHGQVYDGQFSKLKLCRKNICQQAIFYRKKLFDEIGLFDLDYPVLADWVFNIKAFSRRETKPLYINSPIAKYHAEGISNARSDPAADRDRARLIRRNFGLPYFVAAWFFKRFNRFL